MITFPITMTPGEKAQLVFDFTLKLLAGEVLTGVATITVAARSGVDPSPAALLNGTPSVDPTGKMLLVPVQGGLNGVDYAVSVVAQSSNPLKSPALIGVLQVRV